MAAGGEELVQPPGRARNCVRACDAEGVEAVGAGSFGERAPGGSRRQKSRLA